MIDLYEKGKAKFPWWLDWRGDCVAIVAAGPSAKTVGVEKLKNRIHVIAINESYQLCPWADILYSCDAAWWNLRQHPINGFSGLKLAFDMPRALVVKNDLKAITIAKDKNSKTLSYLDDFIFDEPGVIGAGCNSGFQMINMAGQFGATGIMLVGFDMTILQGVHWHGLHPVPLRNPDEQQFQKWRKILDGKAPRLKQHGIDVINCSPHSALTAFKKLSIEQTFERWGL